METNIDDIDFYNLDIDKYLDWLLTKYGLLSSIGALPLIKTIKNEYLKSAFLTELHYLKTRNKPLPTKIKQAYKIKVKHFEKQENEYNDVLHELPFFDSVSIKFSEIRHLTDNEIKAIEIDPYLLNFHFKEQKDETINDFINCLDDKLRRTPLTKINFYNNELNNLKSFDFKYLNQVINARFIYNLDIPKNAIEFFIEIGTFKQIQYLDKLISQLPKEQKHPIKKLSLKPSFEDQSWQINIINESSKDLFKANLSQWENLFSNDIKLFLNPIELKEGTTISELRYFLNELNQNGIIKNSRFGSILEKANAFSKDGKIITANNLKDAHQHLKTSTPKNYNEIQSIFKALKIGD